ncbi:CotH kinase family protein [Mycoplasmatota bacterium WC44]
MNKKITVLVFILLSIFIALTYESSTINPLIVNHPDYSNDMVEELLITTYHSDKNKGVYSYDELVANEGYNVDGKSIKIDVLLQEINGDKVCTSCYGYGLVTSNTKLSLRGQSSRKEEQKSYKLVINSDIDSFKGEHILNLKKHAEDNTRIRNKLIFDLIKDIPNTLVPNTKFVHLTLRDLTNGTGKLEDLGLFTHHEQVDNDFFKRRGLDHKGNLYNINFFDFYRYKDVIMMKDDPLYSKKAFEELLEIKGSSDHSKLIALLTALDSPLIPINQVINKYFDRDNYLTYLAVNMIVDNVDASARNFKLYRPSDSEKWYFIFWDYDKTINLGSNSNDAWRKGIHLYMNDNLHKQFLSVESNRQELMQKMEELKPYFSEEKITNLLNEYKPVLEYYLTESVDAEYSDLTYSEVESEMSQFYDNILLNYDVFYESILVPKAVFIGQFEKKTRYHILTWSKSLDFNNEKILYDVKIARDPLFEDIVYEEIGLRDNQIVLFDFDPGNYFVSVDSINESNYRQPAFDNYTDRQKIKYFGVKNIVAE